MQMISSIDFNHIWHVLKGTEEVDELTREQMQKRYKYRVEDGGYSRIIIDPQEHLLWHEDYQDNITVQRLTPKGVEHEQMKDIKTMTDDELQQFIMKAQQEQRDRKEQEFNRLRDNIIKAIKEMQEQFPYATCIISHTDEDDYEHDVDILGHDITVVQFSK